MSGVADHLFEHARRFLNLGDEERIAYIRAPRWIGHQVAQGSHQRLTELLNRPASLRTQGLMLVGPYANGKTMIAERFAVEHLRGSSNQRVWIVQTREGAGLGHFYASILQACAWWRHMECQPEGGAVGSLAGKHQTQGVDI